MKDKRLVRFDCLCVFYFCFLFLLRLDADCTFPPHAPSPPFRRGGGVKVTFVCKF